MLASFLIGLREGLEASLVVSILVAYMVRRGGATCSAGLRGRGRWRWPRPPFGALFTSLSARAMTFEAQEIFGGIMSIIAVVLVTIMIFWMPAERLGRSSGRAPKAR